MFDAGSEAATPNGYSYTLSWTYNFGSSSWQQSANFTGTGYDNVAVYNPNNGLVYGISEGTGLQSYNPSTNSWTTIGTQALQDYHMTGAIDATDNLLVAVGNGLVDAVNLSTGALTSISTSGPQTVESGNAPGFVWDDAIGKFVGWNGGSTLYTLDPHTWQWTAYTAASDNTVTPTAANGNGTFGRFQYDAADNVFVVVNSTTDDVYILKPSFGPSATAGSGGAAPQMVDLGSGNESFVFNNMTQAGSTIENFDPTKDTLSLTTLLNNLSLGGTDPTTNGTITIDASGTTSTAITLHHNGVATTLVTLDHVLPSAVPHSDIVWH